MDLNNYTIRPIKVNKIRYDKTLGRSFLIDRSQPLSVRKAMYQLALCFKREFKFDFVQYAYDGNEDDVNCNSYMWIVNGISETKFAIGGCSFRKREYEGFQSRWGLQWIWFHPYFRNNGFLSAIWEDFEKKYGVNFYVEPPLSLGMKTFLKDRNYESHTSDFIKI